MALLTQAETINLLFKVLQGFEETKVGKFYFEEWPLDDSIWTEKNLIPSVAPALNNGESDGVVTKWVDLILTAVPGSQNAFWDIRLADAINFKHGDGVSYDWVLKDSNDQPIPKGQYGWLKNPKSQVLYFYGGAPANMPPKITFYTYSGTKDDFGGSSTGGNADNKFRGDYDPNGPTLPTNGSGLSGAVMKGDFWRISADGTMVGLIPEQEVFLGDALYAKIDDALDIEDFFAISRNINVTNFLAADSPVLPSANQKDAMTASDNPNASNEFITVTALTAALYQIGQFIGDFDASGGLIPVTGSGPGGNIVKGDYWRISIGGTITGLLPFEVLQSGDVLHAKEDGANVVADFFSTQGNVDWAAKADVTDPRFPTSDEKAALNAANVPSAVNPVATMADLGIEIDLDLPDQDSGAIIVGDNTDDVIEINGKLKAGTVRTKFKLTITHDDVTPTFDFNMNPFRAQFISLFPSIQFNANDIEINYNVGSLGTNLLIQGIITKY